MLPLKIFNIKSTFNVELVGFYVAEIVDDVVIDVQEIVKDWVKYKKEYTLEVHTIICDFESHKKVFDFEYMLAKEMVKNKKNMYLCFYKMGELLVYKEVINGLD